MSRYVSVLLAIRISFVSIYVANTHILILLSAHKASIQVYRNN